MVKATLRFRLHRTAIVMICLALLVILLQGASYFSLSHQRARLDQVGELAQTLAQQVAARLTPFMNDDSPDSKRIAPILEGLTRHSRILDASVYALNGTLVAQAGERIKVRDRLALDGQRAGSYFNHQIVQPIDGHDGPLGFLRLTLDTHVLATESQQVDNTTNLLRLMILLALAIGIILARTLLQTQRSRWQQSSYLLTANVPIEEPQTQDGNETGSVEESPADVPRPPSPNSRP
ncbi:YtjB family periplasmic protein [Edwardsiella tarda]|uniref:YtjB family periplasmic protein n=1 Tax=Edwardsiella tarda TaxID=636 RepID=UPI0019680129|nr:YtjB family periplasmic protein [Edwardsiella tarda]